MLDPAGRVVLVSGASRGIGRAVARTLHARGHVLSLGVRDPRAAAEVFRDLDPSRLHLARYVAEDWAGAARWVEEAVSRYGRLDALVANAGVTSRATIRDATEAEADAVWAVNGKAPLRLIQLCLPHLEAAGSGRIVVLASLSGKRVRNDNVLYNMTKFAAVALAHAARRLAWERGVRSVALCPSFVRTDMTAGNQKVAPGRMTDPDDLADLVATLIALPDTASVAELLVNCRLEDAV